MFFLLKRWVVFNQGFFFQSIFYEKISRLVFFKWIVFLYRRIFFEGFGFLFFFFFFQMGLVFVEKEERDVPSPEGFFFFHLKFRFFCCFFFLQFFEGFFFTFLRVFVFRTFLL